MARTYFIHPNGEDEIAHADSSPALNSGDEVELCWIFGQDTKIETHVIDKIVWDYPNRRVFLKESEPSVDAQVLVASLLDGARICDHMGDMHREFVKAFRILGIDLRDIESDDEGWPTSEALAKLGARNLWDWADEIEKGSAK